MEKAIISSSVDLTEGGCNACGIIKSVSYTLTIGELELPLDELTVSALVMTLVLQKGFKQEMKMNLLEDYIAFTKTDCEVALFETYDTLTYKRDDQEIITRDRIEDLSECTKKVNDILTKIFRLEAIDFVCQ